MSVHPVNNAPLHLDKYTGHYEQIVAFYLNLGLK